MNEKANLLRGLFLFFLVTTVPLGLMELKTQQDNRVTQRMLREVVGPAPMELIGQPSVTPTGQIEPTPTPRKIVVPAASTGSAVKE